MAKSVGKQGLKKPTSSFSGRRLPWIVLVAVGILLGGGLITSIAFSGIKNALSEQKRMESYLEEKYEKKFAVKNIHKEGSGLGVRGEVVGNAISSSDGLTFEVSSQSDGYHDQYAAAVWQQKEDDVIKSIVNRQGIAVKAQSRIYIYDNDVGDSIKGSIPNLDQLRPELKLGITYSIKIKASERYDERRNSEYLKTFRSFVGRLVDIGHFGSKGANFSIPIDDTNNMYNAGVTELNYRDFLNDTDPVFDRYFKYVSIED